MPKIDAHFFPFAKEVTVLFEHLLSFIKIVLMGLDKEDVIHIYNRILSSHKKEWNDAICNTVAEPRDYHTKKGQKEKDKYHIILLIYGV